MWENKPHSVCTHDASLAGPASALFSLGKRFSPPQPQQEEWVIISTEKSEERSPEKLNHLLAITQCSPEEKQLGHGSPLFQTMVLLGSGWPGVHRHPSQLPSCETTFTLQNAHYRLEDKELS